MSDTGSLAPWERRANDWRWVLALVFTVSALYVLWRLGVDWIPHDDGSLGQSAVRVNQGQLPHRDFDEIYTGGLSLLNALAFRVLGTTLWTLRLVVFAVFLAWVPAVFYLASRFTRPLGAAGVTLLAVVWSLPNYPAALPSWYNLFFATFGLAALFRFLESGRRRWLVAAGVAGGLSFLIKSVGLYYVAGVLLFLVFHSHQQALAVATGDRRRSPLYATFVSLCLATAVIVIARFVSHPARGPELVQYVLPGAMIAVLLARNEWTQPAGNDRARFASLARLLLPFLVGAAVPVLLFLIPYLQSGSVGAFVNGVFVLPMRRFAFAAAPALPLRTMAALLPIVLLGLAAYRVQGRIRRREAFALAVALTAWLVATGTNEQLYRVVWYAVRSLLPVLAIIGIVVLARHRDADARSPRLREQTIALLSVTALCSLVQYPFSSPIYFFYVAPLVALTALALHSYIPSPSRPVSGFFVAFLIGFAALHLNSTRLTTLGVRYRPGHDLAPLELDRGGILVPGLHAEAYKTLIPLLRRHAPNGYLWAGPDAPDIYFLSGLKNPTRVLFDFFQDSATAEAEVLRALDENDVMVVVINTIPPFSPKITESMYRQLVRRYRRGTRVGPYVVLWR